MDWKNLISVDPKVMYGKPVIAGTRVPVDLILEKLALGSKVSELLESYPHLKREQILACLHYATAQIRNEDSYLTPA
ncbi:MAG: DUF433 domain-containing protein [Bacteroidota bacterium]